jgi:hypothetical protein
MILKPPGIPLLLSQHHDCWIVPYNGKPGNTWADKVVKWTGATNRIADSVVTLDEAATGKAKTVDNAENLYVYIIRLGIKGMKWLLWMFRKGGGVKT